MSITVPITFTGVAVYKKNHFYVSSVYDEAADQNVDHALVCRRLDDQWAWRNVDHAVNGMLPTTQDPHTLLNMCANGKIVEFTFPGDHEEDVDTSENGPSDLVHLRAVKKIGQHIFVAGMARRMYVRDAPGKWKAIDQGTFVPRDQRTEPVGFNDMDGFSETDIYAVGYRGEIWHYDGQSWTQDDSPTNVTLTCMCIGFDGHIYIGGMLGVILKGRKNRWASVAQDITNKDFWGITVFQERIYLSNYDGLFYLENDTLKKVDFKLDARITTAYVHAADGIICSVGANDLAVSTDGVNWTRVDNP